MATLFWLSRKAFVNVLLFSCANKNFLFWRLSNDCRIVRPALVSGLPNRKKPYNKHLISLVFSVRTVNYGSSFFSRLGHKSMEKNSVCNLQYGPKTRLIRGIYFDNNFQNLLFRLFVDNAKVTSRVRKHLRVDQCPKKKALCVLLKPYNTITTEVKRLAKNKHAKIWVSPLSLP